MRPRRRPFLSLFVLLGLLAAACGGGRSGTGISTDDIGAIAQAVTSPSSVDDTLKAGSDSAGTLIRGTVAGIRMASNGTRRQGSTPSLLARLKRDFLLFASPAYATGGIENIDVTALGYGSAASTDPNGYFSLADDFSGPVTLQFERAKDGLLGSMKVDVPRGGVLTLDGLQIDGTTGVAEAANQSLSFAGIIVARSCLLQQLIVAGQQDRTRWYRVDLDDSSIEDGTGNPKSCWDLSLSGLPIDVAGVVRNDGSIGDAMVVTPEQ